MKLIPSAIPDVVLIEPTLFHDDRGWFMESFNEKSFQRGLQNLNLPSPPAFVQDNHSYSKQGVLRGLHYQLPPVAQGKLVRVISGRAFDVAVDIREDSPTFGQWVGFELSAENQRMLWIPEGFAHGFFALEEVHFLYKTTDFYSKEHEAVLRWNDPDIGIQWPIQATPILNEKDNTAPLLKSIATMPRTNPLPQGLFDLQVIGDHRGSLIALEKGCNLPFEIKRTYYIFGTKENVSRGHHAHKNLRQVAVCVAGQCKMVLDNGKTREQFLLDSPTKGLLINNMTWREMHDFSDDCILMVFASEHYNETDYIRNYDQFIQDINQHG